MCRRQLQFIHVRERQDQGWVDSFNIPFAD